MDTVSLLIKPASGMCNLRCRYCFYRELMSDSTTENTVMTADTLEAAVRSAFETADRHVSFAFQGGEPLLAGLDFFREFIRLEERYARRGVSYEHSIQTNGTLITPEWADFLGKNGFLIGVSVDGTEALHDSNRVDERGKGSFAAVKRGVRLLREAGAAVNALCVVTGALASQAERVYESLKSMGFEYLQFIPCMDPLGQERGRMPYSLSPSEYAQFLCELFELWYRDWASQRYVSVRQLDDCVHLLAGLPASSCAACGLCGEYIVVEADGSAYPCDFYVLEQTRTGNVNTDGFEAILSSGVQKSFISAGRVRPEECGSCAFSAACGNGGCRRDFVYDTSGKPHNYFCSAYRDFFSRALPRLNEIARLERLISEHLLF